MTPAQAWNNDQRAFWNGPDGEFWVREQKRMDRMLAPVTGPLLSFAAPVAGSTVLDVGCGCGTTTIELARAVGPAGRVVGVDVSEGMLGWAKQRLREFGNATCLLGDAAELPLDGFRAELIFSRFGVMFFGDPVAAFTNLRTALVPGGRLRFACWRPIGENPWSQVPLHAVYEHVPRMPKLGPEEPGPYSFSDTARVERILKDAGFGAISFTPLDVQIDLAPGGTLEEAVAQASSVGPAKRALKEQPDNVRGAAVESIRRALAPYVSPAGVKLAGAVWLVAADRA